MIASLDNRQLRYSISVSLKERRFAAMYPDRTQSHEKPPRSPPRYFVIHHGASTHTFAPRLERSPSLYVDQERKAGGKEEVRHEFLVSSPPPLPPSRIPKHTCFGSCAPLSFRFVTVIIYLYNTISSSCPCMFGLYICAVVVEKNAKYIYTQTRGLLEEGIWLLPPPPGGVRGRGGGLDPGPLELVRLWSHFRRLAAS